MVSLSTAEELNEIHEYIKKLPMMRFLSTVAVTVNTKSLGLYQVFVLSIWCKKMKHSHFRNYDNCSEHTSIQLKSCFQLW